MPVRIEDAEQLELPHTLLIGRQSRAATLENSLPVSCKAKHILTMQPHTPTSMLCIYSLKVKMYVHIKTKHDSSFFFFHDH